MFRFFALFITFAVCFSARSDEMESTDEITQVLEMFQDGYTKRDTSIVDEYVERLFTEDVHLIGTGSSEWCDGMEDVKRIVESDWNHWGDLKLDIDKAVVRTRKDVAWFAVPGTLVRTFDTEELIYERYGVVDIKRIIEQNKSNKIKLLEVLTDVSEILMEVEKGGTNFVYPIRVAGSLVNDGEKWKFRQMVFSYPYPRRLIVEEDK